MSEVTSRLIPNYLTAGTLTGLRRAMFSNNAKTGHFYQYFDIQKVNENGRDIWVAWFMQKVDLDSVDQLSKELVDDGTI